MKLEIFNRGNYEKAITKLETRKAPQYVIEAYHDGLVEELNIYYEAQLNDRLGKPSLLIESNDSIIERATKDKRKYIQEALSNKDKNFLKSMYRMTNMDIFTGQKKPMSGGDLIMQAPIKQMGVKKVTKKLR